MNKLYQDNTFYIFHTNDGYLLQNHTIDGFAHTHLKNYGTALKLIELSNKKKCPLDLPRYLLISLYRINSDEWYLRKIGEVLSIRKEGTYYNRTGMAAGWR